MDNGASSYRRFLDGDDKGIAEIVGDYKDGLILYLNCYVNNIFIAEELTEDTFFRLITKRPRYSGKSTFKSWLYAIGRNVAVDFIRHNSKLLNTPIEDKEKKGNYSYSNLYVLYVPCYFVKFRYVADRNVR